MKNLFNSSGVKIVSLTTVIVSVLGVGCKDEEREVFATRLEVVGSQGVSDGTLCTVLDFQNGVYAQKQLNGARGAKKEIEFSAFTFGLKEGFDALDEVVSGTKTTIQMDPAILSFDANGSVAYAYPKSSTGQIITRNFFRSEFKVQVKGLNTGGYSATGATVVISPNEIFDEGKCGYMYFYKISNQFITDWFNSGTTSSASVIDRSGRVAVDSTAKKTESMGPYAVYKASDEVGNDLKKASDQMKKLILVKNQIALDLAAVVRPAIKQDGSGSENETLISTFEKARDLKNLALEGKKFCQNYKNDLDAKVRTRGVNGQFEGLVEMVRQSAQKSPNNARAAQNPNAQYELKSLSESAKQTLERVVYETLCVAR